MPRAATDCRLSNARCRRTLKTNRVHSTYQLALMGLAGMLPGSTCIVLTGIAAHARERRRFLTTGPPTT